MRSIVLTATLLLAIAPAALAGRHSIVQGPRQLRGLTFESVAFHVPGDWMRNPRLQGRLEVSGSGGKDIDVLVLRESELAAWERKQAVKPLHHAQRVSAIELNVPLPGPDRYVVVLSNRFSKLASKAVAGELRLVWDEDPTLPRGEDLRRRVHFLELGPDPGRQVIPVHAADSMQTVILERGGAAPTSITVRRREGVGARVAVVGQYSGVVQEIGVVDLHGDGDQDVLVVGAGRDSAGTRRDLVLVCPRQLASLSLSLVWGSGTKASPPAVRYGDGYAQARFATEQSFLERVLGAYDRVAPAPAGR